MNWLSHYIGNYPKHVLLVVLVILLPLLSYYLIYPFEIECDVRRGFANKHGRAVHELSRFSNFYNISAAGLEIWGVLIKDKRPDTDLTIDMGLLDEVDRLHNFVWNFTADYKGRNVTFDDVAGADINYVFKYYHKLREIDWMPGINLTFPLATAFGHSFFLGSQFFGVNRNGTDSTTTDTTEEMKTAKFIALWYMSQADSFEDKQILQTIQLGIFKRTDTNFSDRFDFEMFGDQVANAEMLRGTLTTVKLFIIGGMLMITFMAFTFSDLTPFSQVMLIIGAIGSPLAATGACFGLLGWIGHPFTSIMCITPFLILGIGVDDAFLLLNCWRSEEEEESNHGISSRSQNSEERLARVIREISPSMAITSLTNTMAFGVGFLSPTPQMSSFCLGTALAIVLDFIFEFMIFLPVLVMFYEKKPINPKQSMLNEQKKKHAINWRCYTDKLLSVPGKMGVILIYLLVIAASYYGAYTLETTFDPSKTFPSDSKLVDSLRSFTYVQQEYYPLNFITNLPNISNPEENQKFDEMLIRLENRLGCYGSERNHNIYRDFLQYLNSTSKPDSYDYLEDFLSDREMADRQTILWHKDGNDTIVDSLNFVVVCRGQKSWAKRAMSLESTREIVDEYPQFGTTLFDYDATIYDLIITVKSELIKSLAITFFCMTLACFVIMPSFVAPTIASLATVSISFCLVGFLSIWGQNLDPVTMIDVIMAIGFSVDYSAHVCFHYYCARRKNHGYTSKHEIITQVLSVIGRPVIEASLTTLLCMAPLYVVPVYMIRSFAKTVILVTTFGLLHGLLFLPLVLYFIPMSNKNPNHSSPSTLPLVEGK